jgi:hypothetical protein
MSTTSPRLGDLWLLNYWGVTDLYIKNVGAIAAQDLEPVMFLSKGFVPDPFEVLTRRGLALVQRKAFLSTARIMSRQFDSRELSDEHHHILSWMKDGATNVDICHRVVSMPAWDGDHLEQLWDLCVYGLVNHHPRWWTTDDTHVYTLTTLGQTVTAETMTQKSLHRSG